MAKAMGALPERLLIVGCQPAEIDELERKLSPAVERAVDVAAARVKDAVTDWLSQPVDAR
jgi:Ni,Fe-hydrogenase maturation factor